LSQQADDVWGIAASVQGLAQVCVTLEHWEDATVLFSIADSLRSGIGAALAPAEHAAYQHGMTMARTALGEGPFAAVWARASALTPEAAVREAFGPL
jgi:hypothetical protein